MNNDKHNIYPKHEEAKTRDKKGYKTYYIVVKKEFVPVQGKPVELTGFEDFQFFAYKNGKYWQICEATTGLLISISAQTLATTIANTEARLRNFKVTKESMAHSIEFSNKAPTENNIT